MQALSLVLSPFVINYHPIVIGFAYIYFQTARFRNYIARSTTIDP